MDKEKLIQLLKKGGYIRSKKVEKAFVDVPREKFVPEEMKKYAYINEPLPIMKGQTISQPLTVVVMTEALDVKEEQKILEIGTGSGYQAAILSRLVGKNGKVITIERIPELVEFAKKNLKEYKNVVVVSGNGSVGYDEEAPYDRIIVTAEAPDIPKKLLEQLKHGGKMVIPVRDKMWVITKTKNGFKKEFLGYFSFVPLIGKEGY